jgi:hypothetical protein
MENQEMQGNRYGEYTIGPLTFDAKQEDNASISVKGKTVSVSLIIKIVAVLLIIVFVALPLFTIKPSPYLTTPITGLNAALGHEFASGIFFPLVLFLIPLVMILAFQFKESLAFLEDKLFKSIRTLCFIGLGSLVVSGVLFYFQISNSDFFKALNNIEGEAATKVASIGFVTAGLILSVLLYVICLVIAHFCMEAEKTK